MITCPQTVCVLKYTYHLISGTEYVDDEGVRWSIDKTRPPIFLMNHQYAWKSRHNHFQRHSEVKAKGMQYKRRGAGEEDGHSVVWDLLINYLNYFHCHYQ